MCQKISILFPINPHFLPNVMLHSCRVVNLLKNSAGKFQVDFFRSAFLLCYKSKVVEFPQLCRSSFDSMKGLNRLKLIIYSTSLSVYQ